MLASVAEPPPGVDPADVALAVRGQFGIAGDFTPLVSERDQNFRVVTSSGDAYVVKIAGVAETLIDSEFQIDALAHLERAGTTNVPRVRRTLDGRPCGRIEHAGNTHILRVVSYVEGAQLSTTVIDSNLARTFGSSLAALDIALQGFSHPGERPVLLWDLQRVPALRDLLHHIDDVAVAAPVTQAIDDFEALDLPRLPGLRCQVIHGDANPENVLLDPTHRRVAGFIDFGDMLRAPLIIDVAIASAYLRATGDDALLLIAPFVAGYHTITPLQPDELLLLFDLIRARLAMTIAILYWRLGARGADDPYRQKTLEIEATAICFLNALDNLGRDAFLERIERALSAD